MPVFLTLGPITFANYEIPQKINFGGTQALAVKQLVGGMRVVDAMGRLDDDITWSGLFFGSTSTFRARYLDFLRVQGNPMPLTWSQFNYQVVIKDFKASFERNYQIPYTITVQVIQDLNKPFPVLLPVGYNDAVIGLLTEANDLAVEIANPSITSAMAILSAAINALPSIVDASSSQIAGLLSDITNTQQAVTTAINAIGNGPFIS